MALSAEKRAAEPVQAEEARARRVLRARRLRGADTEAHTEALRSIGIAIAAMAVLTGLAGGAALMWRDTGDVGAPEIVEVAAPVAPASSVIESVDEIAAEVDALDSAVTPEQSAPPRPRTDDAADAGVSAGTVSFASCDFGSELSGEELAGVMAPGGTTCAEPGAIAGPIAVSD